MGAFTQQPLDARAVSPECRSPRASTAAVPSPCQQGDVPTFWAAGARNNLLVARTSARISAGQRQRQGPPSHPRPPASLTAAPHAGACGAAAKGAQGPAGFSARHRGKRSEGKGSRWVGRAGPHLPRSPPACQGHAPPLRTRPSRGAPAAPRPLCPRRAARRVTSMAGPAGCRGGEIAAPQPLPAPLHPPRAASASVIPARRARAVRHRAPPRGTGGAEPRVGGLGGWGRVGQGMGRDA